MRVFQGIDDLAQAAGTHMGHGEWHTVTQEQVDLFADATGDHQWIHVDPERAAGGPFGTTIAHGYLTLSLVPLFAAGVYTVEGVRMAVNYGCNKVRFPAPVPVGSRLRGSVTLDSVPATVLAEKLSAKLRIEYVPMVRRLLTALGNRGTAPFASINLKNPVFVGCGSGADIARALADAHRADIRPASEKGLPQVLILLDPHAGKFAEGRDGKVSSCEGHAIFVLKVGDQEKILQFSIYPLTNQEICPSSPALKISYADAMRHLSLGFLDAIVKKDPVAIEWLEHDAGRWLESVGKLQYA